MEAGGLGESEETEGRGLALEGLGLGLRACNEDWGGSEDGDASLFKHNT